MWISLHQSFHHGKLARFALPGILAMAAMVKSMFLQNSFLFSVLILCFSS